MKLSDLKISHIIFAILLILWGWFFYDTFKYRFMNDQWRQQAGQMLMDHQNILHPQQIPQPPKR